MSKWKDMVGTAFSLAIVGYVINLAMGRTLAAKHGYDVDPNQVQQGWGSQGLLPLLSGVQGRAQGVQGERSDVLGSQQTCCSRGGSVALCHVREKGVGTALCCGVERGWEGERSFRLGSLPCSPSTLCVLEHGEVHALPREQSKTWIPGVSPRYCERQDIK